MEARYIKSFIATFLIYCSFVVVFLCFYDDLSLQSQNISHNISKVKFTVLASSEQPQIVSSVKKPIEKPMIEAIEKKEIFKPIQTTKKPEFKKNVQKVEPKIAKTKLIPNPPKEVLKEKEIAKKVVEKKVIEKPAITQTEPKKTQQTLKDVVVKKQTNTTKSINKSINQIEQIKASNTQNQKNLLEQQELKRKKQNIYFTQIKEKLYANKIYPKIAVRRGIEDDVKLSFKLSKSGDLLSYEVLSGKKVFLKSIAQTLQETFPLKPEGGLFDKDIELTLTLQYRLHS
ncbi:MAG: energy transducer TonB [Campylobacterales bacterium]|nr:energy transducer TonB [Campylobacterales bacterium]